MRSRGTASSSLLLPVLAVALAPVLVACGDDDSTQTAPAAPTVEVAGEPAVDPVTEPADPAPVEEAPSGPSGEEAVAFFRSTEADCAAFAVAVGNDVLPAYYFDEAVAVQDLGNGSWVIADGSGVELVVDLSAGVVHGLDGPTGVLPIEYSFGCPEDLYLGSLAE
ncbi:hypothetical protein [uncultured Nocardioides sp.]|uniref:hypothetical protein n=1 Tax=uncultured Nocardioides sp. TaxID=198441 RepID=UPI00260B91AE|nr:hypothetical protein [uncultured Nocardioides sp.]